ncbi:MAG TPA: DUF5615 family PIN-like protein, partial [Terriglobales bacterium]|nr:DUF5615 family PIN-like protein [Terriglobales bacterium]
MKLKLDENIDARRATLLCNAGHNTLTVREQNPQSTDDPNLCRVCVEEGRTLVTLDLDFANILQYPPENTPGLIVLR